MDCDKSLEESVSVAKRCGLTRVIVYIDTPESLRKAEEKAKLDIEREQELDLLRKEAAAASLSNNNDGGMLGLLTTAPLSIHVAISAGIVITSVWIIKKMF